MTAAEAEKISSEFIRGLEIKFSEFTNHPEFVESIDKQIKGAAQYGKESHHVGNIAFLIAYDFWKKSFPDDTERGYVRDLYAERFGPRFYQLIKAYLNSNGYTVVETGDSTRAMVYWGLEAAHIRYKAEEIAVGALAGSKSWFSWKSLKSCLSKN